MTSPPRTPYQILGVDATATQDEIRRAYRRQALRFHPDRNPGDPTAQEAFIAVREAFEALEVADPDAGFDAERVMAEMEEAAQEAARRRGRESSVGRGWQQVRVALDRTRGAEVADRLRSPRGLIGVGVGIVLAGAVGAALSVAGVPLVGAALGGVVVGGAIAAWRVSLAPLSLWAVETHPEGLRDWRWDVLVRWNEIRKVEETAGGLHLHLEPEAVERLRSLVPSSALAGAEGYHLPLADGARFAALIRTHVAE